ncbi:MAG: LLM class flavin-dependent oxidoreductase, partial [Candidatus Methylomirabilales bacterium]
MEKFNTLYIGHVDMDSIGLRGTPANDRRFPNEHLITAFDKATAICQTAERCGLDCFWLAEHHFQREGYECIPNILMLAVH